MPPAVPKPDKETQKIQQMFTGIARRYDLLNHVLSGWTDVAWRRWAADAALEDDPTDILDVACGTGDLAIQISRLAKDDATIVGSDFTGAMLRLAGPKSRRLARHQITWIEGDGLHLPFADASFDAVTIAFGLRNMESWEGGLREMARVLRPGGRLVCLEFSQPENWLIKTLFLPYFVHVLPRIAGLLSEGTAYRYLSASVMHFPGRFALARMMKQNGYSRVQHCALTYGIAAIHIGIK
ncbi:bifunctional demethylmenaquinone methyltransferase/2-methoxy-6-polyprenyl-1,4-benzoquinol methylase UbiE [bacterium]|nr:bifunctional demethylmenaquinone methyltransferase/2-methoxy-6-polyprenyl-1,4-benzoquinol methylase UbiE [bacterium]